MKKIVLFLQKNYQIIYNLFLFIVAALAILYILPDNARFKYDYERGQVWVHEDLEAPFDFPIFKTREAMIQEKEQWNETHPLYFYRNRGATDDAAVEWNDYLDRVRTDSLVDATRVRRIGESWLRAVMQTGVLTPVNVKSATERTWYIARQGVYSAVDPDYFYTTESLPDVFEDWGDSLSAAEAEWLLVNLPEYVVENVQLNRDLTDRKTAEHLDNLSHTEGMISEGDVIVHNGQVVDKEIAQVLYSYRRTLEGTEDAMEEWSVRVGYFLLVGLVLTMLYFFLKQFRPQILVNSNSLTLILVTFILMILVADIILQFDPSLIYIAPFPIVPILLRSFYDTRLALFIHLMVIVVVGLVAPNSFEFVFLQFMAGIFSIITVTGLYRRSQLFTASAKITGVYLIGYFAFTLVRGEAFEAEHWSTYGYFAINGILSVVAYPLIYLFEKIFGQVSDLTLLELGDTNSPLLRELRVKAPGTFQHSLQVGNLAESVIDTIGGNPLLVRTGALYHDIGKMKNPLFFVENQTTGINAHDDLDSLESARMIIDHVKEGILMAKSKRIPDTVIDFIRTHHGTTRVEYFYRTYQKEHEGEISVEIEEQFRYPGPKPFSKETAVLMMADTVEAATRSLVRPSADQIRDMVDKLIDHQLEAGQFDSANITLGEISTAREVLKKKLMNIHHLRVEYPE